VLAFGNVLQTMRVPLVKETFETNVAGVYIAGELSGMGLIKTAINEGRLAIDSIRRRLEASGDWRPPRLEHGNSHPVAGDASAGPHDVVIVGAGPAGLSASLAAQQHGLDYLTLEQGEVAATIRNYPRHKFLMAEPTDMPLYGTLYIGDGTKESLLHVWEAIVANTGVRIQTNERVESICRTGDIFVVETGKGRYETRHVILALGKRGTPRKLGVTGEELPKVAYGLIEADTYADADILVVGGGDSAIEAALALSKAGRNRVTLSYRGASFDRARERNRNTLASAEQEGRIRILRKSHVREITPDIVRIEVESTVTEIPNNFVFILAGGESPETFLRKTGIEIVEKAVSA
jgi:putative YpdA family bacillithiol system oxidoreductase